MHSNLAGNLCIPSTLKIRLLNKGDLPALEWDGEYIHYRRLFKKIYKSARKGNSILWVIELKDSGLIGQLFVQLASRP